MFPRIVCRWLSPRPRPGCNVNSSPIAKFCQVLSVSSPPPERDCSDEVVVAGLHKIGDIPKCIGFDASNRMLHVINVELAVGRRGEHDALLSKPGGIGCVGIGVTVLICFDAASNERQCAVGHRRFRGEDIDLRARVERRGLYERFSRLVTDGDSWNLVPQILGIMAVSEAIDTVVGFLACDVGCSARSLVDLISVEVFSDSDVEEITQAVPPQSVSGVAPRTRRLSMSFFWKCGRTCSNMSFSCSRM